MDKQLVELSVVLKVENLDVLLEILRDAKKVHLLVDKLALKKATRMAVQ